MKSFAKRYKYLIAVLLLGFVLRTFRARELFLYSHDQDLLGWFIRDVLSGDLRLIGQETSSKGIFIGPIWYYLLVPFYFLSNMDPVGGLVAVSFLSVFTIWSFYFVFSRIFDHKIGLIAALVYAVSSFGVAVDMEVVPTTLVMPWSVWFLYALHALYKGEQKIGFIVAGILTGLVWHVNLALGITLPLLLVALILAKKRIERKWLGVGVTLALVGNLPLLLFEYRHGFQQLAALTESFGVGEGEFAGGVGKIGFVMAIVMQNLKRVMFGLNFGNEKVLFAGAIVTFTVLVGKRFIDRRFGALLALWVVGFIGFFISNSIITSEYYLNGMNAVWFFVFVSLVSYLWEKQRFLGIFFVSVYVVFNIANTLSVVVNESGYIHRKEIVAEIARDSRARGYPCVSVSYVTAPGREFGYRYLFWLEDLHVNQPSSGSPVYTIIYPLKDILGVDEVIGDLGLAYPQYEEYSELQVQESCSGENANLTDPLFGYTR